MRNHICTKQVLAIELAATQLPESKKGDHQNSSVNQQACQCEDNLVNNGPNCDCVTRICLSNFVTCQLCQFYSSKNPNVIMSDPEEEMEDGLNLGSQATIGASGLEYHVQGALTTLNTP